MRTIDGTPVRFEVEMRHLARLDQGVSIRVVESASGRQLIRFDCYDRRPHYHYDPDGANERLEIDGAVPHARAMVLEALRNRAGALLERANASHLRAGIDPDAWRQQIDELEAACDETDRAGRARTIHRVAPYLWRHGDITVGLTPQPGGVTVHVYTGGESGLTEALCFDCFGEEPHYHYAPALTESVVPWDLAVIGDPLEWTLARLTPESLLPMLVRAGYPEAALRLDAEELQRIASEVRERAVAHA